MGDNRQSRSELAPMKMRFVEEFLSDPDRNATAAAKRAGYSIKNARNIASHLLDDPKVQRQIQIAQDARSERIGISKERVLQELALVAFFNVKDIMTTDEDGNTTVDLNKLSRDAAAPIVELVVSSSGTGKKKVKNVRIRPADKLVALEKLGKHLGMFDDRLQITGKLTLLDLINQSMETESLPILEASYTEVLSPDIAITNTTESINDSTT